MSSGNNISGLDSSQDSSLFDQYTLSAATSGASNSAFSAAFQQATAANGSTTEINLNHATLGQVLAASQSLGLDKVNGYLETMSTDTDGSSATANVLKDSTAYNIPGLLDSWAQFDQSHGATQGAQQVLSIEKTLVSHADANGNLTVDTATYNAALTTDGQ